MGLTSIVAINTPSVEERGIASQTPSNLAVISISSFSKNNLMFVKHSSSPNRFCLDPFTESFLRSIVRIVFSLKLFIVTSNVCCVILSVLIFVSIFSFISFSYVSELVLDYQDYHFDSIITSVETEILSLEMLVDHVSAMAAPNLEDYWTLSDRNIAMLRSLKSSKSRYPKMTRYVSLSIYPDTRFCSATNNGGSFNVAVNDGKVINVTHVEHNPNTGEFKYLFNDPRNFVFPFLATNDTWTICGPEYRGGFWRKILMNVYYKELTSYYAYPIHRKGKCVGFGVSGISVSDLQHFLEHYVTHKDQLHFLIDLRTETVVASSKHEEKEVYFPAYDHPLPEYDDIIERIVETLDSEDLKTIEANKNLQEQSQGFFQSDYIHFKRIQRKGLDLLFVSRFGRDQFYRYLDVSLIVLSTLLVLFVIFLCSGSYALHSIIFLPLDRIGRNLEPMSHLQLENVSTQHCSTFSEIWSLQNAMNRCIEMLREYKSFLPILPSFMAEASRQDNYNDYDDYDDDEEERESTREGKYYLTDQTDLATSFHEKEDTGQENKGKARGESSKEIQELKIKNNIVTGSNDTVQIQISGEPNNDSSYDGETTNMSQPRSSTNSESGSYERSVSVLTEFRASDDKVFSRKIRKRKGIIFILYLPDIVRVIASGAGKDFRRFHTLRFLDAFFSFVLKGVKQFCGEIFNISSKGFTVACFKPDYFGEMIQFSGELRQFLIENCASRFVGIFHFSYRIYTGIIGCAELKKRELMEENLEKLQTQMKEMLLHQCESSIYFTETAYRIVKNVRYALPFCFFKGIGPRKICGGTLIVFELKDRNLENPFGIEKDGCTQIVCMYSNSMYGRMLL